MLIIALVLAAIGLAALVFAVVTSNALVAWVCIVASLLGVLLLIVDALRERRRNSPAATPEPVERPADADEFDETADEEPAENFDAAEPDDQAAEADLDEEPVAETADESVTHPAD